MNNVVAFRGTEEFSLNPTLQSAISLAKEGVAVHWLRPRSKAPIESGWSEAPIASVNALRRTYVSGNNLGIRLGEPSQVSGGFLHAIDLDIRITESADEAWSAFASLFPTMPREGLPEVASGSGGESRHLYFITDRPLPKRRRLPACCCRCRRYSARGASMGGSGSAFMASDGLKTQGTRRSACRYHGEC